MLHPKRPRAPSMLVGGVTREISVFLPTGDSVAPTLRACSEHVHILRTSSPFQHLLCILATGRHYERLQLLVSTWTERRSSSNCLVRDAQWSTYCTNLFYPPRISHSAKLRDNIPDREEEVLPCTAELQVFKYSRHIRAAYSCGMPLVYLDIRNVTKPGYYH